MEIKIWLRIEPEPNSGCWIWIGHRNEAGYGIINCIKGLSPQRAHRVSFEIARGPIPAGLQIDHLCRNRACVNPAHLEAVPQRENILRGVAPAIVAHKAGACRFGHPLVQRATTSPDMWCRVCDRRRRQGRMRAAFLAGASIVGLRRRFGLSKAEAEQAIGRNSGGVPMAFALMLALLTSSGLGCSTFHSSGGALVFKGGASVLCPAGIRETGSEVICLQPDAWIKFRAADVVATKYFYEKRIERPSY